MVNMVNICSTTRSPHNRHHLDVVKTGDILIYEEDNRSKMGAKKFSVKPVPKRQNTRIFKTLLLNMSTTSSSRRGARPHLKEEQQAYRTLGTIFAPPPSLAT